MSEEIYKMVLSDAKEQKDYQDRQSIWYQMRHNGLRRKTKPWPGAADMHFPLADSIIEKHKPFYYQQIFAMELVATFQSLKSQDAEFTMGAAQWFDYRIKQKTNFETESLTLIDHMLMSGLSILQIFWDDENKRVRFDAIDPVYFIAPKGTTSVQTADRLCKVCHYSVETYKKLPDTYNKDPDFIKRITGFGGGSNDKPVKNDEKYAREGITYGQNADQIILHEVYEPTSSGWVIHFYSPLLPSEPARSDLGNPYLHKKAPFVEFVTEIKDKGFYSPRGIPEIVSAFESSLCKTWNEKLDAMTLYNRPIYSATNQISPTSNIKLIPGQIVNAQLTPLVQPNPPMSFDQEMMNTRMIAEYRVGMPDFGQTSQINTDQRRTATEVNNITALMGQNIDLRARIFRGSLAKAFQQAWSLYLQYDRKSLQYFYSDQLQNIPEAALHEDYIIAPSGSADSYNKQVQYQKAIARYQMFQNNPFVNQGELTRSVIEVDDPKLVKTLFINPQQTENDQMEEQADEINNMLIGFPVQVDNTDNHEIHLQTLLGFIQRRLTALPNKPAEGITPELARLMLAHGGQHYQALIEAKSKAVKQLMPQMKLAIAALTQIASTDKQMVQGQPQPAGLPQ